jgi:hypothetical protein
MTKTRWQKLDKGQIFFTDKSINKALFSTRQHPTGFFIGNPKWWSPRKTSKSLENSLAFWRFPNPITNISIWSSYNRKPIITEMTSTLSRCVDWENRSVHWLVLIENCAKDLVWKRHDALRLKIKDWLLLLQFEEDERPSEWYIDSGWMCGPIVTKGAWLRVPHPEPLAP